MEIRVEVEGENSVDLATDLKAWLGRERTVQLKKNEQNRTPPSPGELGPELMPILTLVLASPLISELVKSIFSWLEAKRASNKITLKIDGKELTFDVKDSATVSEIVEKLSSQNVSES